MNNIEITEETKENIRRKLHVQNKILQGHKLSPDRGRGLHRFNLNINRKKKKMLIDNLAVPNVL